ncbi:hypothetical protein CMO83_02350 [Candidatus Woesearchaeota archaeon]|jgi:TRAP-type C4-dicarboxylate transport system permease small subunit|nr:hypothetical protein [Candidatus Woesearchaeota archaeon]MDP6648301.1 hypothetical protein [Candidatus Woesearchaeota archaeon]|tara:strand:+ start:1617 stop:2018 length:402 start_codon:yes stop_codon:yes gene_type:complete
MNHLHRKADAATGIALLLIILFLLTLVFIGWTQRECRTNKDCGSESYCGSDYSCHQFPNIQKTVVQNNFFVPSLIIGLAIVIAAVIFNWHKIKQKEENNHTTHEREIEPKPRIEKEEIPKAPEGYYKTQSKNP